MAFSGLLNSCETVGFAIFFTLLPLSGAQTDRIQWAMLKDAPLLAAACFLVGVGFWIA